MYLDLSTAAVVGPLMHMKSCVCRNSESLFCAVELVLFYGNLGSANLQLLSRPSCFYFLLHILAFFKHLQFSLLFLLDKNWHHLCCGHVCEAQCAAGWGIHLSSVDKIIHLSLSLDSPGVRRPMYQLVLGWLKKDTLVESLLPQSAFVLILML